jgi:hypothetical protein
VLECSTQLQGKDALAVAWEIAASESFYPSPSILDEYTAKAYGCASYAEAKKECGGQEVASFRKTVSTTPTIGPNDLNEKRKIKKVCSALCNFSTPDVDWSYCIASSSKRMVVCLLGQRQALQANQIRELRGDQKVADPGLPRSIQHLCGARGRFLHRQVGKIAEAGT